MRLTREAWLASLVLLLRPIFGAAGFELPGHLRISCGFPSRRATSARHRSIGQAFHPACSSDGAYETFISPILADPVEVAAVVAHELCHHAVGTEHGHRGPFKTCATALGLLGPMRATSPAPELRERLHALCTSLGPYPHATLTAAVNRQKQSTRMLLILCSNPNCLVRLRMTRAYITSPGLPRCACDAAMQLAIPEQRTAP